MSENEQKAGCVEVLDRVIDYTESGKAPEPSWLPQLRDLRAALEAAALSPAPPPDVQVLVNRFLAWKLPDNVQPDGIYPPQKAREMWGPHGGPIGTNLLDASAAKAMFEHVLAGYALSPARSGEAEPLGYVCPTNLQDFRDGHRRILYVWRDKGHDEEVSVYTSPSVAGGTEPQVLTLCRLLNRYAEAAGQVVSAGDDLAEMQRLDLSAAKFRRDIIELFNATTLAPRNESSGVSPGGGEYPSGQHCPKCRFTMSGLDYCVNCQPTPAPQDSVRVGDGVPPDDVQSNADYIDYWAGRLDSMGFAVSACVLRGIAIEHRRLATPAPAAGADGGMARLAAAVMWAREEWADKEHVARCRGEAPLADYYGRCKKQMDAALSDGAGQSAGGG